MSIVGIRRGFGWCTNPCVKVMEAKDAATMATAMVWQLKYLIDTPVDSAFVFSIELDRINEVSIRYRY